MGVYDAIKTYFHALEVRSFEEVPELLHVRGESFPVKCVSEGAFLIRPVEEYLKTMGHRTLSNADILDSYENLSDREVLTMEYISLDACAVKVRFSAGGRRYTNLLSLLRPNTNTGDATKGTTSSSNGGSSSSSSEIGSEVPWCIVSIISSSMDESLPKGLLFQTEQQTVPDGNVPKSANYLELSEKEDEEAFAGIIRAAHTYMKGNHASDADLMQTCMHPSTHLLSVDAATGAIADRPCQDYYKMMATRKPSFHPSVLQYDKIIRVTYATCICN
jgi:hypothetical protein